MARAIKITSVSGALTVTITGPNGGTPTVYADSQLANTQSMPATIADTATTTFWLPGPGKYTLSVKTSGGTEIAGDNNQTRAVDLETDSTVAALNYDARTLATVAGDSGHSAAGSTASGTGLPANVVSKTTTYTATAGDFVEGDTTSAGFTVTLPLNPAVGALVATKKVSADTNTLTIAPSGGGTIDGDATATITVQWAGGVLEHKGSNVWRVSAVMTSQGPPGPQGATGATGTNGQGVPTGGTTGQVLAKNSATNFDTAWTTPSSSGVLAYVEYLPFPKVSLSVTATSLTAVDATNLAITFTAPASGTVRFRAEVLAAGPSGASWFFGVLSAGSRVGHVSSMGFGATTALRQNLTTRVSGLTPGTSYTFQLAAAVGSGSGTVFAGGDDSTSGNTNGQAILEVWSM